MGKLALHWQILIGIVLAVIAGLLCGPDGAILGVKGVGVFDFIGSLFLRALQMLVVPLILGAVILAAARLGVEKSMGRLGLKTLGYYMGTGLVAILTALIIINVVSPGRVDPAISERLVSLAKTDVKDAQAKIEGHSAADVVGILQRMIPDNVFAAASDNRQMLGLIVFGLLFGYCAGRLPNPQRTGFLQWWQSFYDIMMQITDIVVRFAPIGVFGLVAETVATTGLDTVGPLFRFALCVIAALAFHMFVSLPIILRLFGIHPFRHFAAMAPALLTAVTTASSNATLPMTLECLEKRSGVSERVRGFFIPVGANINTDGTALYECAAAMFIAQIYGIEITLAVQFTVVALALLTSIGVAGVPAASLVAIAIILNAIGLPLEGVGMILAVDRILDMCRTSVNVYGDSCGAVIIARSEGEKLAY